MVSESECLLRRHRRSRSARRPVSRVLSASDGCGTVIPLGHASLRASRDQPGRRGGRPPAAPPEGNPACRPYSVLLPVGFTLPPPLPAARCALTAPFHPCPQDRLSGRAGGLFSVALSLGSPPPAVSRHRPLVEPGLSSTASRLRPGGRSAGGSDRPAVWRVQADRGTRRRQAGLRSGRRPASIPTAASRRVSALRQEASSVGTCGGPYDDLGRVRGSIAIKSEAFEIHLLWTGHPRKQRSMPTVIPGDVQEIGLQRLRL